MYPMTVGTVRTWNEADGSGVVDSPETPGGCWTHFSVVEVDGYRHLVPGQSVQLDWDERGQDGYPYRAVRVTPI